MSYPRYAIVSCSRMDTHVQVWAVVVDYAREKDSLESFERLYRQNYAHAGDATYRYLLVTRQRDGSLHDFYTKEYLGHAYYPPDSVPDGKPEAESRS